ncbi:hypothetical protein VTI74DRAFT_2750 [Chaetomium olivicolor]
MFHAECTRLTFNSMSDAPDARDAPQTRHWLGEDGHQAEMRIYGGPCFPESGLPPSAASPLAVSSALAAPVNPLALACDASAREPLFLEESRVQHAREAFQLLFCSILEMSTPRSPIPHAPRSTLPGGTIAPSATTSALPSAAAASPDPSFTPDTKCPLSSDKGRFALYPS